MKAQASECGVSQKKRKQLPSCREWLDDAKEENRDSGLDWKDSEGPCRFGDGNVRGDYGEDPSPLLEKANRTHYNTGQRRTTRT
jgi:hypothetical protein